MAENLKFLIDESDLQTPFVDVPAALERLLSRILAARRYGVGKFSQIWEELVNGYALADWLFDKERALDRDLAKALQVALDRSPNWDEVKNCDGMSPDVRVNGVPQTAYSLAAAASFCLRGEATGCVSTSPALESRQVSFNSSENEVQVAVAYVGDEATILKFFRELPEIEDSDQEAYFENATFAFPKLKFYRERTKFAAFDEAYTTIRKKVTHHLAILNDHAPSLFARGLEPRDIQAVFGSFGVEASGESGNTKSNAAAMRQRKVVVGQKEILLDWHTKVRPHLDRIYFRAGGDEQHVLIGVFHMHLD